MVGSFRIIVEIVFHKIRKKENLKYSKHNKELDCKNNQQTLTGNTDIPESVHINSV